MRVRFLQTPLIKSLSVVPLVIPRHEAGATEVGRLVRPLWECYH